MYTYLQVTGSLNLLFILSMISFLSCASESQTHLIINIIPLPGCQGQRIAEYKLSYLLNGSRGVPLNNQKVDAIVPSNAQAYGCQVVEDGHLKCYRKLKIDASLDPSLLMIQVEAIDEDSGETVLVGQGRAELNSVLGEFSTTIAPQPAAPMQAGLSRVRTFSMMAGQTLRAIGGSRIDDIWAVGDNGSIERWNINTWLKQEIVTASTLYGIWSSRTGEAWAVGDAGALLRYSNNKWITQSPFVSRRLYSVVGNDINDAWAFGEVASIFHWDGMKWSADRTLLDSNRLSPSEQVLAASVDEAGNILAIGAPGGLTIEYDAKNNKWQRFYNLQTELSSIWISNITSGWAVGGSSHGSAFYWNGQWSSDLCSTAPMPLTGVWGASPTQVWAVGKDGGIYQLLLSGCQKAALLNTIPLYSLWGYNDELLAVGAQGLTIHACIAN